MLLPVPSRDIILGRDTKTNLPVIFSAANRDQGTMIIGQSRFGKSSLLLRLIENDIENERAVIVLDPHGDLLDDILAGVQHYTVNIIVLDVLSDPVFGMNPYACENPDNFDEVEDTVDNVVSMFKRIYAEDKNYYPRIETILRQTAYIIVHNGLTMAEIPYLFASLPFRQECMQKVRNPQIQLFWDNYNPLRPYDKSVYVEGAINRLNNFLQRDLVYRIISQRRTTIPFKQIFQEGGILLVRLPPKNRELTNFLGTVFTTILGQMALAQSDYLRAHRRQVMVYLDEYSRFASTSTANLYTEGGKFGICMHAAFQNLNQLKDEDNRAALLGSGNLFIFQPFGDDAEVLVKNLHVPDPEPHIDPRVLTLTKQPFAHLVTYGSANPRLQTLTNYFIEQKLWPEGELNDLLYNVWQHGKSWLYSDTNRKPRYNFE